MTQPIMPNHLSERARDVWRLVVQAHPELCAADSTVLAIFCEIGARWVTTKLTPVTVRIIENAEKSLSAYARLLCLGDFMELLERAEAN